MLKNFQVCQCQNSYSSNNVTFFTYIFLPSYSLSLSFFASHYLLVFGLFRSLPLSNEVNYQALLVTVVVELKDGMTHGLLPIPQQPLHHGMDLGQGLTYIHTCCCCLPCNHCSNWTWVVEEILAFGTRLRSTHCREFNYLKDPLTSHRFLQAVTPIIICKMG